MTTISHEFPVAIAMVLCVCANAILFDRYYFRGMRDICGVAAIMGVVCAYVIAITPAFETTEPPMKCYVENIVMAELKTACEGELR